jgi:alpha(1,3/1,4) fucosyltransferase
LQQADTRMTDRKTIRINFSDFWHGNSPDEIARRNPLYQLLSRRFDLQICEDPDFLIYSSRIFGQEFMKHRCVRIFYTGENDRPDFEECDFAFTFDYLDDPRHYRLPLYKFYVNIEELTSPRDVDAIIRQKTEFCAFLVSNPAATERIDFFHALSRYKKVDSGGKVLNNIGGRVDDRFAFLKSRKFSISFENSSYPGYSTEKLILPWLQGCVPIYCGNPLIGKEFNTRAFVNCHDCESTAAVIDHIASIDKDPDLFREYLSQPLLIDNKVPDHLKDEAILDRFESIFSSSTNPVATSAKNSLKRQIYSAKDLTRKIRKKFEHHANT